MNRLLREYLRIAKALGVRYVGFDGNQHHVFETENGAVVRAPGTPRSEGTAVNMFRLDCMKDPAKLKPIPEKPQIDGNEVFRKYATKGTTQ